MRNYFYDRTDPPAAYRPLPTPLRFRRRKRVKPVFWFVVFLLLISGTVIAAIYLSYGYHPSGGASPPAALSGDESFPPVSIPRAPTGDGTVLVLEPQPDTDPLSYQEIYLRNIPAIVFISATGQDGISQGTGIVLSEDGYILTNAHVIAGCYRVDIALDSGEEYEALLVGQDEDTDIAVLKVDARGLSPAEFGESNALQVGDRAIAIGNPLGEELRGTMTDGIISAINRDVELDGKTMVLIQTTAALNSGNSGGALINEWGQVVGITTLKMSSWYESIEGLGFAIPTATAKTIVDELIAVGKISGRPTIGITVRTLTKETAAEYGAGTPAGLRLEEVDKRSDAWKQGLRLGDVVVAADGTPVLTVDALNEIKNRHEVGDTLRLRIWREGEYMDFTVHLMEQYELDS